MANPNLQLLTDAAKLLKPILGELVFVGGCATALLITDSAAADVRPTFDVDAIAEITSYAAYTEFSERLRKLGSRPASLTASFQRAQNFPFQSDSLIPDSRKNLSLPRGTPPFASAVRFISRKMFSLFISSPAPCKTCLSCARPRGIC
jgi:hypothetical protein